MLWTLVDLRQSPTQTKTLYTSLIRYLHNLLPKIIFRIRFVSINSKIVVNVDLGLVISGALWDFPRKKQQKIQMTGELPVYKCLNGCGNSYTLLSWLQRHMLMECEKRKEFLCDLCDKNFTSKILLEQHIDEDHSSD